MGRRLSVSMVSCAPKPAQQIDLQKLTCRDLLAADVLDRSSVMMFYWGYTAAQAGVTSLNTADMEAATARVMETCTKNQGLTLFAAIKASKHVQ